MRDGVQIAVDVTLPAALPQPNRLPTILRQTRYHRRMNFRGPSRHPAIRVLFDQQLAARRYFVEHGYAWVDVCARGSGASGGRRPSPWSVDEVEDGREIVDWIVAQAWSNGRVGARGVSYDGTASEFLLVHHHPAVRAIAPRFSLFDAYEDIAMPGGIHLEQFTRDWSRFNDALDRNRFDDVLRLILELSRGARKQLASSAYGSRLDRVAATGMRLREPAARALGLAVAGVAPTDFDPDGRVVSQHVAERKTNLDVFQAASRMTYRDDTGLSDHDPDVSINDFSPHVRIDEMKGSAAVFHYSGWLDGAYQRAAIKRFHAHDDPTHRLIIGPWEHGGRQNISPWETSRDALFPHEAELRRFFDAHLRDDDEAREVWADTAAVRYFTMGAERWQSSEEWPPASQPMRWHLGESSRLQRERPDDGDVRIPVDGGHGTGRASRWRCLLPMLSLTHYEPRSGPEVVRYTSAPLTDDLEVTGHPVAHIELSSTTDDPRIFVYLEDVDPSGTAHYVTEGQLRAIHRRQKRTKPTSHKNIPYRTFERSDRTDVDPGQIVKLDFDLLPTSYLFRKGHSIRVGVAGADVDHFEVGPQAIHTVLRASSWVELPVVD